LFGPPGKLAGGNSGESLAGKHGERSSSSSRSSAAVLLEELPVSTLRMGRWPRARTQSPQPGVLMGPRSPAWRVRRRPSCLVGQP
jgi:hypothetical protein